MISLPSMSTRTIDQSHYLEIVDQMFELMYIIKTTKEALHLKQENNSPLQISVKEETLKQLSHGYHRMQDTVLQN